MFPIWGVRPDGSCQCNDTKCTSPGKHPHGRLVPNGLKDASDDEETVRSWWRQYPQANVGLVTGEQFFVIDCDKSGGADGTALFLALCEKWDWIPETAAADTGGGGAHFCFAMDPDVPVRNQQGLLIDGQRIHGIDVRGIGGYIVAPPSVHHTGKVYVWARPLWETKAASVHLLSILAKAGAPPQPAATVSGFLPSTETVATLAPPVAPAGVRVVPEHEVASIKAALKFIPPNCDRTTWVERVGMPLHDHFGGSDIGFEIFHGWSELGRGLQTPNGKQAYEGRPAVHKVWRSFRTRHPNPKGIATMFETAAVGGYVSQPTAPGDNGPPNNWPEPGGGNGGFTEEEIAESFKHAADPGPFPPSVAMNLEGPVSDLVEWIVDAARRPDRTIALASALAIVAGVLGRRVIGPDGSRPMIALAVLAPSGSGKDKPQECIKNLIESHPNLQLGLMDDTPTHRTQLDDLLLKNKGQGLMVLDEYGSTLGRWLKQTDMASASMSPVIRRLATHGATIYHLAPVSLRHPSRAANVVAWDQGIFAPAFSMIGFATPGQFYEALSESSLTDGFLGRHVVLASGSTENLRSPRASTLDIPARVREWLTGVQGLPVPKTGPPSQFQAPPGPGPQGGTQAPPGQPAQPPDMAPRDPWAVAWGCEADEAAWEGLCAAVDRAAHRALAAGDETLGAILRRLPGQTACLALVLACGEATRLREAVVTERHVELAYRICRWSADHLAHRLRRGVASDDVGRALLTVCEVIERRAPGKTYRSYFAGRAKVAPWLNRIWPLIESDPRFEATAKWACVRAAPVSLSNKVPTASEKP